MITQFCPNCETILNYNEIEEENNTKHLHVYCNNCGFNSKSDINLIQKKYYKKQNNLNLLKNRELYVHDNTLARTIHYKCPNDKCKTHSNKDLKKAIFLMIKIH